MMNFKSLAKIDRSICLSVLTLAAVATVVQPEQAAAVDLDFSNLVGPTNLADGFNGFNFGPGSSNATIDYLNVASGIDARVTATPFGTGYSLLGHLPNYSQNVGQPSGDTGFLYNAATPGQAGGLTYKFDLFNGGGTFTTPLNAQGLALRFLVYDVDGEPSQSEAVRIAKNSGLVGYQLGNTAQALTASEDANSYLFTGPGQNFLETDASGAAIFYFENTNSVTFRFEANTLASSPANNAIFSAIDGDLSLIGGNTSNFAPIVSTAVPEPFTIIGTIIGGTAAVRMRKKLKADKSA